jgi:uncharacterized protein YodC (DUF2158 family)
MFGESLPIRVDSGSEIGGCTMEIIGAGDVVQLRSGGPNMTVISFAKDAAGRAMVYCEWFVSNEKHQDFFCISSLKGVDHARDSVSRVQAPFQVVQDGM